MTPATTESLVAPIGSAAEATQRANAATVLSPQFYTTDFDAMNRIDVSSVRTEWTQMLSEYEGDNNADHFKRTDDFVSEIKELEPALQQEFLDFLISSVTSEYSGCVLYNEIRQRVTNPDIKQLMTYLTRDESRHANFLNASLKDYGLAVDLKGLQKTKPVKYFSPKFIFYALYLSEKIGYARYISIYRQLQKHPEKRFHPIFKWFERWCHDEFRHGESLALIMRADPSLLKGFRNTWWIRFFLTAVYSTMFVRDHTRPLLHRAMGLDSDGYDYEVFRITTEISKQVFPVLLDTDSPRYRAGLDRMHRLAEKAMRAKKEGGVWNTLKRGAYAAGIAATFVQLMLVPTIPNVLPEKIRVDPVW